MIKARLKTLRAKHARLLRSARLAKISLGLTTPAPAGAVPRSRFDQTLDDAGSVLARELQILLYALIVAGPLFLLGGLAVLTSRTQRIRSDRRLLERSASRRPGSGASSPRPEPGSTTTSAASSRP